MKRKGKLTLIPTPLSSSVILEPVALELLKQAVQTQQAVFVVEEHKEARRRWLAWGLDREAIKSFVLYNEHNRQTQTQELLRHLQQGRDLYLLSDCGLPAFCDPGQELIQLCHLSQIQVTATPFPHSVSLAVALSGFKIEHFWFEGFLPRDSKQRRTAWRKLSEQKEISVVMDTPYRLERCVQELTESLQDSKREIFLALDLNQKTEELIRTPIGQLKSYLPLGKREFVLVIGPK